ncbi:ABC transporter ATP-binding protein [Lactobacillus sp. DCY120]|uniref:ABC transporter ATP-binding protein n=1 Tax=Bombilactobacillus apium TaxID=2675299 RepID=A0A850R9H7_9LACO|nr:ABC transporter ATP-binding protein [Bombilactobacillus apium]NVY97175.1 ABC transporter ATP-binding protein [Bombilactobacillus apium]
MKITKNEIMGLISSTFLLIIAAISESAIPTLIGQLVDSIKHETNYAKIGEFLAILAIVALLINRFGKIVINTIMIDIIRKMRNKLIDIWIHTSWQKLENKKSGEFVSLVNDDLDNIRDFAVDDIPMLVAQIIGFFVAITQIFVISKIVTLILFSIYLIYLVPFRKLIKKQYNAQKELRDSKIKIKTLTADIIHYQEELAYIDAEGFMQKKFLLLYEKLNHRILLSELAKNSSKILPRTIDSLGPAIVILYGGYLQLKGSITIGNFVTIFTYLSMFSAPFKNAMNVVTSIQEAFVSIDKIKEYLNMNDEILSRSIYYQVKSDCWEKLKNISSGEYVILKGLSGTGKSTLLKYIYFSDKHSRKIMYVPQNVIVFPGTIRENLLRNDIDSGKFADLLCFLPNLDNTISSGKGLSTGQKMVLNVIRQSVFDADLILLDEIGANIDNNLKRSLGSYFIKMFGNKTIIEITHLSEPLIAERSIDRVLEVK